MNELKLVNEFPRGVKRYDLSKMLEGEFGKIFHRHFHVAAQYLEGHLPKNNDSYRLGWGFNSVSKGMVPQSKDDYPIFKVVDPTILTNMSYYMVTRVRHHTDLYQGSRRIDGMDDFLIPSKDDPMYLQYDPVAKQLIHHNAPYEGPVIKTKNFTKVNKAITATVLDLKNQLTMMSLIVGEEGKLELADNVRFKVSDELMDDMEPAFDRIVDGSFEVKDLATMCVGLRQYQHTYSYSTHKHTMHPTKITYKWYPGLKKKIYFKYGAFQLPDNHLNWFDEVGHLGKKK